MPPKIKDVTDNDLDWMHRAVPVLKWRCVKKDRPRRWELEFPFRLIPHRGPPEGNSIGLIHVEKPEYNLPTRRMCAKVEMSQAREMFHAIILHASMHGRIQGMLFRQLVPITTPMAVIQSVDIENETGRYDIFESGNPVCPNEWIMKDKVSGAMVLFEIPPKMEAAERKAEVRSAMLRVQAMSGENKTALGGQRSVVIH